MVGFVEDVVCSSVYLLGFCPTSTTWQSPARFVAPMHEVSADVLAITQLHPYQSPSNPGFRAQDAKIPVSFKLSQTPCAIGHMGARTVHLADMSSADISSYRHHIISQPQLGKHIQEVQEIQDASPYTSCVYSCRSSRARIAAAAWEWDVVLDKSQVTSVVAALERQVHASLVAADGDMLCDIVHRALGGLFYSTMLSNDPKLGSRVNVEKRLWRVIAACMDNLDPHDERVRRCCRGSLRHIGDILKFIDHSAGTARDKPLHWIALRKLLSEAYQLALPILTLPQKKSHAERRPCNICKRPCVGKVKLSDSFGPAGRRCLCHSGRACNVQGCTSFATISARNSDMFGGPGRRCVKHGRAFALTCNVLGCSRPKVKAVKCSDQYGESGNRCHLHGANSCTVPTCRSLAWGTVPTADDFGPAGRRCYRHGGFTCSVPGCKRFPRKKGEADHYGPAGIRCDFHSAPRVRKGQRTPSVFGAYKEPCKKHRGSISFSTRLIM